MAQVDAGWYTDPGGRHGHRYWNGIEWTDHVADSGVTSVDGLPDAERNIPPAPETQQSLPPPPPVAVTQTTTSSGGFGAVLGWIVAIIAVGALVAFLVFVAGNDDSTTTSLPSVTTTPVETTAPVETTIAP